jgi:hypothetical protein
MKGQKVVLMGILVVAAVFGLVLSGCSNDSGGSSGSQSVTYSGGSGVEATELIITKAAAGSERAYTPQTGDTYVLKYGGVVVSQGTITSVSDTTYTFASTSVAGNTFTVTITTTTVTFTTPVPKDDGTGSITPPSLTEQSTGNGGSAGGLYENETFLFPYTIAQSLDWLAVNAKTNASYTIKLSHGASSETLSPRDLSSINIATLTIEGLSTSAAEGDVVQLGTNGSLFTVGKATGGSPQVLILKSKLTLKGTSTNDASLVMLHATGTLKMQGNAMITGNKYTAAGPYGGGVFVDGGSFDMTGNAKVSDNEVTATSGMAGGGGVAISDGTFDMSGSAVVSGNKVTASSTNDGSRAQGGGIYSYGGNVTMGDNSVVTGNNTTAFSVTASDASGGGVFVSSSTFDMSGSAKVSDNETFIGGGMYIYNGRVTMSDSAEVSGNTTSIGSGVYLRIGSNASAAATTFTMSGSAKVSGNTAFDFAGGVGINSGGEFIMGGSAKVSGNTASSGGGVGIYIGEFTMNGGTIYGSDAGSGLANTAETGASLYNVGTAKYGDGSDIIASGDGTDDTLVGHE